MFHFHQHQHRRVKQKSAQILLSDGNFILSRQKQLLNDSMSIAIKTERVETHMGRVNVNCVKKSLEKHKLKHSV
jgi:hypothetical protein